MPNDPITPFQAWGVMGLLGVVIVVLVGVIWKLFGKQSSSQEVRDKVLMDFVNTHRKETTASMQAQAGDVKTAMEKVADTVAASNDRMSQAFREQSRSLDRLFLVNSTIEHVERLKRSGIPLTAEEIDRLRALIRETLPSYRDSDRDHK